MISYIVSIILTVVSGILLYILQNVIRENRQLRQTKKQHEQERETALINAVLSLLRIQLIEYYDKYMKRENIPLYIYENWDEMFSAYDALGGNGSIKRMNDDIKKIRLGGEKHENN